MLQTTIQYVIPPETTGVYPGIAILDIKEQLLNFFMEKKLFYVSGEKPAHSSIMIANLMISFDKFTGFDKLVPGTYQAIISGSEAEPEAEQNLITFIEQNIATRQSITYCAPQNRSTYLLFYNQNITPTPLQLGMPLEQRMQQMLTVSTQAFLTTFAIEIKLMYDVTQDRLYRYKIPPAVKQMIFELTKAVPKDAPKKNIWVHDSKRGKVYLETPKAIIDRYIVAFLTMIDVFHAQYKLLSKPGDFFPEQDRAIYKDICQNILDRAKIVIFELQTVLLDLPLNLNMEFEEIFWPFIKKRYGLKFGSCWNSYALDLNENFNLP